MLVFNRMQYRVGTLAVVALMLALVLAACGGDDPAPASPAAAPAAAAAVPRSTPLPTPTTVPAAAPAKKAAAPAPAIEDVLYAAALAEGGEIIILDGDDVYERIAARGFTDRFPGIKFSTEGARPTERSAKLIAQSQAGRIDVDMFSGSARDAEPVISRGLIAGAGEIDWDELGYPADLVQADGHLGIVWDFVYAHEYNTDLVDPADLPKKLTDFLDPRWKGKITASPFLYPAGFAFVALEQGEEATVALAKNVFDTQGITLTNSYLQLVESGEFAIAMYSSVNNTLNAQAAGAPVGFFFTEDMGTARLSVGLVKDAPHPNSAKLFFWWLNTEEGQQANLDEVSRARATGPGVDNQVSNIIADQNVALVLENDDNWQERARLTGAVRLGVIGQ